MRGNWKRAIAALVLVCAAARSVDLLRPARAEENKQGRTYRIVDTGQAHVFSDRAQLRSIPKPGHAWYGQDAFYVSSPPQYRDNGDGTVTDLVTGLTWTSKPYTGGKVTYAEAKAGAVKCRTGSHSDWRLPTIKELYSLIDFNGCVTTGKPVPYIDTKYFSFRWGNVGRYPGRIIDSQYWSSTEYVGTTMYGQPTVFGVNFADGRIKGYPRDRGRRGTARHYVIYCRGNKTYGKNRFVDNKDGTVSDLATGLMWAKTGSNKAMVWKDALAYCEGLNLAGYSDWRLPNAKELQSLVDYTRGPDAKDANKRGPAIDPVFGMADPKAWFWSSTTHLDGPALGRRAAYVAFGRAMGYMTDPRTGRKEYMDVHGAGAQRSDPKSGDPNSRMYSQGLGPQGDEIRIYNYARAVRNIDPNDVKITQPSTEKIPYTGRPPEGSGLDGTGQGGDLPGLPELPDLPRRDDSRRPPPRRR